MEENEPKQRRPRTSNPAFSTPDQPTPQTKPAKAPPAVTFRPPAGDKTSSGTGTEAPDATPSTRPQRNPAKSTPRKATAAQRPAKPAPAAAPPTAPTPPGPGEGESTGTGTGTGTQKPTPPSRTRAQAATKPAQHRVEAATDVPPTAATPSPPAKAAAQPETPAPAKTTPAKRPPRKTAPPAKAGPAKAVRPGPEPARTAQPAAAPTQPAQAEPTPAKPTPAEAGRPQATPVKKAAATIRAAAAEVAPAVVKPDLSTVPDEQRTATPAPTSGATSPAAEPPATAPGQPGSAVPVASTLPRGAAAVADTVSGVRTEAWAALIADPGHGPELLALAATQTIGPRAEEWAARTRAAYPGATPDALARLAVSQFSRFGSVSSVFAAVAGSYAPIALLGAAAFTHAELALHVAAAYGLEPTDRERAVDLLVLTRVHPCRDDAVAALDSAEQRGYEHTGLTDATWRLGRMLAAQAGGWVAVRAVNHFFPGTSLLLAALTSRGAARAMAARAIAHYRGQSQPSQSLGSSV